MLAGDTYSEDIAHLLSEDHDWKRLRGSRVLVTGATGMVGSVLVDVLASKAGEFGFTVTAMSRNRSELERLFSCHGDAVRFLQHDVNVPLDECHDHIFHLASNTHPIQYASDPIGTMRSNIIGLDNMLSSAVGSSGRGRFVFASSVEIYGQERGDSDAFDESYCGYIDCNTVRAGYNESKRAGEALCQAYGAQMGLDFVIPRLSRLYGPSMRADDSKALSQFIRKAVAGEDIVLKSAGDQVYSYCYSADAVSAILHLFFKGECGGAYNVAGPDTEPTLRMMAEILAEEAGTEVVFDMPDAIESKGYSKASRAVLDTSKIEASGWKPRTCIRDGLRRTVSSLGEQRTCRSETR